MNVEDWTQIGVGGLLCVTVLKLVLDFLGKQRQPQWAHELQNRLDGFEQKQNAEISAIAVLADRMAENERRRDRPMAQLGELHKWHAPDDGGEQTWKNKHLIDVVGSVQRAVEDNTKVITRLIPLIERLEARL